MGFARVGIVAALVVGVPVASAAHRAPGGVYGVVVRAPVTPVCVAERPCSAPAAGVKVQVLRSSTIVATTVTRSDGSYRIVLQPGRYVLRVASTFRSTPIPVVVQLGWTRKNLSVDTGIRTPGPVTGGPATGA